MTGSASGDLARLISQGPAAIPLVQTGFRPAPGVCQQKNFEAAKLFPGAREAQAALAGILLRLGCWEESHGVAQDVASAEGSYWHGIVHRIEPDSANARYWFRQVGAHPIFPQLLSAAALILLDHGPKHWKLKSAWDPSLLIDWCDEARQAGGELERAAIDIQMAEWQLLFDWCAG